MKKLLLTALALFVFYTPAMAQDDMDDQIFVPPGTTFQNHAADVNRQLKKQSLEKSDKIEVGNIQVSLVHYHYMDPDQFGIMMKLANSSSGCFELSPLEYEASFIDDNYMDIKVKDYRRKVTKTENPTFDCDQKSKVVSALVVVSAKDLEKRGVKQIRFSNGKVQDRYDVTLLPDSVVLVPDSMIAFKAQGLTGPDKNKLVYYFSGKALVAVQVPMADKDEDIAQSVRNLAYRNALQPVFEQEGLDTSGKNNVFYFMDPNGRTLDSLNEDGYAELGTIQVLRPYVGPEGRQGLPVALKVFVTRPGTTL
ncbi:MAG TPA: hypothetical protein PLF01_02080 [Alphaproteobacteria bacterium]|nr:hypothetical protein [Alphaproteobacteria bacterium]